MAVAQLDGCILRKSSSTKPACLYRSRDGIGFGSIRRFNFAFQQLYGRTPTELRRLAGNAPSTPTEPTTSGCHSGRPTTGKQSRPSWGTDRFPVSNPSPGTLPADHHLNRVSRSKSKFVPVAAPLKCASSSRCSSALPHRGTYTTALRSFGRPRPHQSSPCPRIRCSRQARAPSRIAASRRMVAVRTRGRAILGQQISVKAPRPSPTDRSRVR